LDLNTPTNLDIVSMVEDKRKWVGVRLSRLMMQQIETLIEEHLEWAWSTPNDFVRDAVRRHMEYVRTQGSFQKQRMEDFPKKAREVMKQVVDEGSLAEFEAKLDALLDSVDVNKEPKKFLDEFTEMLAEAVGPTLAKKLTGRLYDGL